MDVFGSGLSCNAAVLSNALLKFPVNSHSEKQNVVRRVILGMDPDKKGCGRPLDMDMFDEKLCRGPSFKWPSGEGSDHISPSSIRSTYQKEREIGHGKIDLNDSARNDISSRCLHRHSRRSAGNSAS